MKSHVVLGSMSGDATCRPAELLAVARGGYPGAFPRDTPRRRSRFFSSYLNDIMVRDVKQVADIERAADMRRLITLLGGRSAQTIRPDDLHGLRYLKDKLGSRMHAGYVLYCGDESFSFGDGIGCLPISALWTARP